MDELRKASNDELLVLTGKILAKPGNLTPRDVKEIKEINEEFKRRDKEFLGQFCSRNKS